MNPYFRSWIGQVVEDKASLQSLLDSCHKNVQDAAREEAKCRALYAELPAGHPLIVGSKDEHGMAMKIRIAVADKRHWQEYVSYYSARVAKEGGETMIPVKLPKPAEQRRATPAPPRQQQREPGSDDGEQLEKEGPR